MVRSGDSMLVTARITATGDAPLGAKLQQTSLRTEKVLKGTFCGNTKLKFQIVKSFSASNTKANFVYVKDVFFSSSFDRFVVPF